MQTKGTFLQQFRKNLPGKCPVKFNVSVYNPYSPVNVAEDDGEVYFEIGRIISLMDDNLQNWFDSLPESQEDEMQEKLCDIFCREYNLEF